jgi:hypothetical protein
MWTLCKFSAVPTEVIPRALAKGLIPPGTCWRLTVALRSQSEMGILRPSQVLSSGVPYRTRSPQEVTGTDGVLHFPHDQYLSKQKCDLGLQVALQDQPAQLEVDCCGT